MFSDPLAKLLATNPLDSTYRLWQKNEIYSFFKSSHDERNGFFLGSETIKWMSRNMLSHDLADLQTFYPTQRI
jgi:hypothetical protein